MKKLQASTLIEVLVALVIIMIVFALASKIYLNTFMQAPSYTKISVNQQLQQQLKACQSGENIEYPLVIDSINYDRKLSVSGFSDSLDVIEITATQEQQVVGKIKGIIIKTDEED